MNELLENVLLAQLPKDATEALAAKLRRETLTAWQMLRDEHEPIKRVYFPIDAIISVVSLMEDGSIAESYAAGRDGVSGSEILWGDERPIFRVMCQVPGIAYSMEASAFRDVAALHRDVPDVIRKYAHCVFALTGRSAACNLLHQLVERCARWLLLTHDRVAKETFELTQDILATMLGVHRPAVTVAAGTLQKAGFIQYTRGKITVVNRAALEDASCECYRVVADEFCRVLGGPTPQRAR